MAKINTFYVKTIPYKVSQNPRTRNNYVNSEPVNIAKLEVWVSKKIAGGNLALANSIRTLHRKEIKDISNLMMFYLDSQTCNNQKMEEILKKVGQELKIDIKALRNTKTSNVVKIDTNLMLSLKKK